MRTDSLNGFEILPRHELSRECVAEMFHLLSDYFEGVTWDQFSADLAKKNWVVLVRHEERVAGFSTLQVYESTFAGEPVSVVYSGDTIVAPEAWGTPALARGWITAVRQLRAHYWRGKYYWLLLTSGFRTYRFLPVFWREFHPCYALPMPDGVRRLRDHLARERFRDQYDPSEGIVQFLNPQRLRGSLSAIPSGRTTDPHIAFFAAQNSGHSLGNELVCLTELGDANLTAAGRRMVANFE